MSQYNQLYTPQNSAIVFIDHQPQMLFGVSGIDRAAFINNVTLPATATSVASAVIALPSDPIAG